MGWVIFCWNGYLCIGRDVSVLGRTFQFVWDVFWMGRISWFGCPCRDVSVLGGTSQFVWDVFWMGHISLFGCPCWDVSVCRTSSFSAPHALTLYVFTYIIIFERHSFINIIHTYVRALNPCGGETSRTRPARPWVPSKQTSPFAGDKTVGAWL